ncbi:MAG TPA: septal ring lytic transglycosylase RlpA family protein [Thermoleophilaceae bacterium]
MKSILAARVRSARRAAPIAAAALVLGAAGGGAAIAEAAGTTGASTAAPTPHVHAKFTREQLAGHPVRARGVAHPSDRTHTVLMQARRGHGRWQTVDRARTQAGHFRASWRPSSTGRYQVRAVLAGATGAAGAKPAQRTVRVYRAAAASWYGPGFYGHRTACGHTLTPGTLGVANKSLPCGTRVTFRYGRYRVTVPVIDRGPYAGARVWDLTPATKSRLHFPSTGVVWSTR